MERYEQVRRGGQGAAVGSCPEGKTRQLAVVLLLTFLLLSSPDPSCNSGQESENTTTQSQIQDLKQRHIAEIKMLKLTEQGCAWNDSARMAKTCWRLR
jgi:hypothetical protein